MQLSSLRKIRLLIHLSVIIQKQSENEETSCVCRGKDKMQYVLYFFRPFTDCPFLMKSTPSFSSSTWTRQLGTMKTSLLKRVEEASWEKGLVQIPLMLACEETLNSQRNKWLVLGWKLANIFGKPGSQRKEMAKSLSSSVASSPLREPILRGGFL